MAVALQSCRVLHERKELDDHLLPVGKESMRVFLQQDADDEAFPTDGKPLPGSSKRKQFYDKRVGLCCSCLRRSISRGGVYDAQTAACAVCALEIVR